MFPAFLQRFFSHCPTRRRPQPCRPAKRRRLRVEMLEDRTVPSTVVLDLMFDPDGAGSLPARDIGDVTIVKTGSSFTVTYQIVDVNTNTTGPTPYLSDYFLTASTIQVDNNVDFSSPEFTNAAVISPRAKSFTNGFTLPASAYGGGGFNVKACANVVNNRTNLDNLAAGLPNTVSLRVAHPGTAAPLSYFDTTVTNGGTLNGFYADSWCADSDRTISSGITYNNVAVYSSYENLPLTRPATISEPAEYGGVEKPQNLDLVNWILNQHYVGQASPGGYGIYTYGDVQRAIWQLLEDDQSTAGLGSWNVNRVNEIAAAALVHGEGFVPSCDQTVAILFRPTASVTQVTIAQTTVSQIPFACESGAVCVSQAYGSGAGAFAGGEFTTYTRGAWSAPPSGNNPAQYLHANFEAAFGTLTVYTRGGAGAYVLDTAPQVRDFLRANNRNPYLGYVPTDLEKQVLSLKLDVGFDVWDPNFSASTSLLGNLELCNLTGSLQSLIGKSIFQAIGEVDNFLNPTLAPGNPTVTLSGADWLTVIRSLNEAFDNGTVSAWANLYLCRP